MFGERHMGFKQDRVKTCEFSGQDGGSTSEFRRNQMRLHPVATSSLQHQPEEAKWLETSTIRQQNITRMLPNPTALLPKIMAKATMQRAKNIHPTPSNTPRMLDSPASKPTTRANSKSKLLGPTRVGPYYCPLAVGNFFIFIAK
jgi:hypothetical protein